MQHGVPVATGCGSSGCKVRSLLLYDLFRVLVCQGKRCVRAVYASYMDVVVFRWESL